MTTVQKIQRLCRISALFKRQHIRNDDAKNKMENLSKEAERIVKSLATKDKEFYAEQVKKYTID